MQTINELTQQIIGFAIEVHRVLGPGLNEAAYAQALYKGELIAEHRPDLVVAERVVVEAKAVERLHPVHTAQMLTYLKVTGRELALILNFNEATLVSGIKRVVLQAQKTL